MPHSREHMAAIGAQGGKAKKPGCQNNRFTPEQARAAQLKAAAARVGRKYRKGKARRKRAAKRHNMWGVPKK